VRRELEEERQRDSASLPEAMARRRRVLSFVLGFSGVFRRALTFFRKDSSVNGRSIES
jgi:hypothetical protein